MITSGQLALIDASRQEWEDVPALDIFTGSATTVVNGTVVIIIERPDFLTESCVQYVMTPCGKRIIVEDLYLHAA